MRRILLAFESFEFLSEHDGIPRENFKQ